MRGASVASRRAVALRSIHRPHVQQSLAPVAASLPSSRWQQRAYTTNVFQKQEVAMADKLEDVVVGGRHLFEKLPTAFEGLKHITVIGWSSQGPAQAMNLRDSLKACGSDIKVSVGLREGSASMAAAESSGFSKANGTLGDMWTQIADADMVILLIADAAQVEVYEKLFATMKPGATLGLSHGFLVGVLEHTAFQIPKGMDVVAVCPKGFGPSVRRLYVQGETVNGAGINCSFAVHQNGTGRAVERALGWAVAIGAPYVFETTLTQEYRSDIFGERGVLLGGLHGMTEFLYNLFKQQGMSPEAAFKGSAECITGPLTQIISKRGILAVYQSLAESEKALFEKAYSAAYHPCYEVLWEIYDEVSSGRELTSVCDHTKRFGKYPMGKIDGTEMWVVGEKVRAARSEGPRDVNATTAGVYCACMMAQIDLLMLKGHCHSEVVNESVIEAVDSLNPYVDFKGIAHMVDNCSWTARLGARKWAPRFDYLLKQLTGPRLMGDGEVDKELMEAFKSHKVHDVMKVCGEMRPAVDIALVDAK